MHNDQVKSLASDGRGVFISHGAAWSDPMAHNRSLKRCAHGAAQRRTHCTYPVPHGRETLQSNVQGRKRQADSCSSIGMHLNALQPSTRTPVRENGVPSIDTCDSTFRAPFQTTCTAATRTRDVGQHGAAFERAFMHHAVRRTCRNAYKYWANHHDRSTYYIRHEYVHGCTMPRSSLWQATAEEFLFHMVPHGAIRWLTIAV